VEINRKGVDWIYVDHYRDEWRAVVNTIMKFRISLKAGISWPAGNYKLLKKDFVLLVGYCTLSEEYLVYTRFRESFYVTGWHASRH
jgi:hypothetical protein